MIHYWECQKCTRQWVSSCHDHIFQSKEEQEYHRLKPYELCDRCWKSADQELVYLNTMEHDMEDKDKQLTDVIDNLLNSMGYG